MEMMFKPGNHNPEMNWELVWYRFKKTRGIVKIPIGTWYRASDNVWMTIAGRKSIMSNAHISLRVCPDAGHVGRYIIAVHVKTSKMETALPLGVIYNDRKYPYEIKKGRRSWEVTFDGKSLSITVHRIPAITLNSPARLSEKRTYEKEIIIEIEDALPPQSDNKNV